MKRLWSFIKALPSKLIPAVKATPRLLLNVSRLLLILTVHISLALTKLLFKMLLALPKVTYNMMKGFALTLICALLALMVLNQLNDMPGPGVPSIQLHKALIQPLVPSLSYDSQRAIVRLSINGQFTCSGVVIGRNYLLTASHCIVDQNGVMKDVAIQVEGDNGRVVVMGRPAGINLRMDWGLIQGDFTSIPGAHVMSTALTDEQTLTACGFPQGNHKVYCAALERDGNDLFLLKAKGLIWPGMSGGPVFDKDGTVVALNIRGYELSDKGGSGISPTIGILANFNIGD